MTNYVVNNTIGNQCCNTMDKNKITVNTLMTIFDDKSNDSVTISFSAIKTFCISEKCQVNAILYFSNFSAGDFGTFGIDAIHVLTFELYFMAVLVFIKYYNCHNYFFENSLS